MNNYVGDGNGYIGNIALKPEKAHILSATLDLHGADRSWGVKATLWPDQSARQLPLEAGPG